MISFLYTFLGDVCSPFETEPTLLHYYFENNVINVWEIEYILYPNVATQLNINTDCWRTVQVEAHEPFFLQPLEQRDLSFLHSLIIWLISTDPIIWRRFS